MLTKVITGGQTGAERAAWRAALAFGIARGGWMPRGFVAADGAHPEFATGHNAEEMLRDNEAARIERNVQASDATLWFGETTTALAQATVSACFRQGKPCLPVSPAAEFKPPHVAAWLAQQRVETLNVTGSREEEEPGIGQRVEQFLIEVLQQLGHERA